MTLEKLAKAAEAAWTAASLKESVANARLQTITEMLAKAESEANLAAIAEAQAYQAWQDAKPK